jgi:hypothetical protein
MLGLFKMTFDYYTWEDLICISDSSEKLVKRYNQKEKESGYPLFDIDKSRYVREGRTEEHHYVICPVEVV